MIDTEHKIVAYAVELRLTQKRRLALPEGVAQDAARDMEWIARKKLNALVDLYLHCQEKAAAVASPESIHTSGVQP